MPIYSGRRPESMSANLFLLRPDPPTDLVEKRLDWLVENALAEFAGHLEAARNVWRKWPHLVVAPEFPAELRGPYERTIGHMPSDERWASFTGCCDSIDPMDPNLRELLRPEAKEVEAILLRGA
jgi:hypothetical protein